MIPRNIRLAAIKHHHLALRADEDINVLRTEMRATFNFFLDDWKHLSSVVTELKSKPSTKYYNGAINQIQLACLKCESLLLEMKAAFNIFIVDLPELPVDSFNTHTMSDVSLPIPPHADELSIEGIIYDKRCTCT